MNAEVRIKELEEVSAMMDLEENELSELRNRVTQANTAIKIVKRKILQLSVGNEPSWAEPTISDSQAERARVLAL
jgi:ribosomal protein L10